MTVLNERENTEMKTEEKIFRRSKNGYKRKIPQVKWNCRINAIFERSTAKLWIHKDYEKNSLRGKCTLWLQVCVALLEDK